MARKQNYSHIFQIEQELQLIKQQPNQSISDELKLYRLPNADLEELQ
jgi:hypothetical protein